MAKMLEMVCHANECRSKLAEAIANKYIQENNIQNILISSSGIYVDAIKQRKAPLDFLIQTVYKGIGNRIYTPEEIKEIEEAMLKGILPVLGEYAEKAAKMLMNRERQNRDYHARKNGLLIEGPSIQTIMRPDLTAIVCMDEYVKNGVSKIYSGTELRPQIDVLGNYISTTPVEIPHTLGVSDKEFAVLFQRMKEYIPRIIETFLKESK